MRALNAIKTYSNFLKMTGGKWTPPLCRNVEKLPFIPTHTRAAHVDRMRAQLVHETQRIYAKSDQPGSSGERLVIYINVTTKRKFSLKNLDAKFDELGNRSFHVGQDEEG